MTNATLAAAVTLLCSPALAQDPQIERISLDVANHEILTCINGGKCKNNSHASTDALGHFVVWETDGYAVVPEVPNPGNRVHVYLRDLAHGTTALISQNTAGQQANSDSSFVVISGDASTVVFLSTATNLDPDDKSPKRDVFARSLLFGTTWRVTELQNGTDFNGPSSAARISFDGRAVAFTSTATNLKPVVPGLTSLPKPSGAGDIYVAHGNQATFEWISIGLGGALPNGPSLTSSLSFDASLVAFSSNASNLLASPDPNDVADVFLRDRVLGVTHAVSVALDGTLSGTGHSVRPMLAGHGGHVVFQSDAQNLVPDDGNGCEDIFVRDLASGTTVRVNVTDEGVEADAASAYPAISADGRFVVFSSLASNLAAGVQVGGPLQFYAHDRDADEDEVFDEPGATRTWLVSRGETGEPGNGASGYAASMSADGSMVPFLSEASNLVLGDGNGTLISSCSPVCRSGRDIFLRSL